MKLSSIIITAASAASSGINSLPPPATKLIVAGALFALSPRAAAADSNLKGKIVDEILLGVPQEDAAEFDFDPAAAASPSLIDVITVDDVSPVDLKVPDHSSFIKKVGGGMSLRKRTFLEVMEDADLSDAQPISLKGADDFTEVGKGFCKDDSSKYYSYIQMYLPNVEGCYDYCLQEPENGFVGIQIYPLSGEGGYCDCLFSDQGASDVSTGDYNPPAYGSSSYDGSGAIQSSSGWTSLTCYSYNHYVPPSVDVV